MKRPLARSHIKPVVAATAAFEASSKTAIVQDEECLRIGLMGISGVSSKYDLDDAHY
jgi:hypothetical protein